MTDQVPADKVREIIGKMHDHANHDNVRGNEEEYIRYFADRLETLLPPPPRPTLAGMTPEERYECRLMQADVRGEETRPVIVNPFWEGGSARVMWPGGFIEETDWDRITPRPDLPSLEWPGDKKPAPDLPGGWRVADHKDNGRVIVTTPNNDGRVYYVLPSDLDGLGFDWFFCHTDELTYLDGDN